MFEDDVSRKPHSLLSVVRKFLPKELIPPTWKCEGDDLVKNVQNLIQEGNKLLGMFETSTILWHEMYSYMNFPRCLEYFNWHAAERIAPFPYFHKSMNGKFCLYRNDLYKMFDYWDKTPLPGSHEGILAEAVLDRCWHKLINGSHHELIVCPEEPINMQRQFPPHRAFTENITSEKYEQFVEEWKQEMKERINNLDDYILTVLDKLLKQCPGLKFSTEELARIISWVGYVIGNVKDYAIKGHIHLPPLNSERGWKPLVRKFSFDCNHFVMADELVDTLKKLRVDVNWLENEVAEMPDLSSFPYNEIEEKIGETFYAMLEFVDIEITQFLFTQSPIPSVRYDDFCLLAVDALHEILMDMILAKKVFQKITPEDGNIVIEFLESLKFYFDPSRDIFFVDIKVVDAIKTLWDDIYVHKMHQDASKAKLIIKTKSEKFEEKELCKTLDFLELYKFFDNIKGYANKVHKNLAGQDSLTRRHVHVAVALCQINCLARKVSWMLDFVHMQKACPWFGIVDCERCRDEGVEQ
ncbi:hypothetical protein CRE_16139 [Caenorhabditis remanei]|uniref:Uncharacterized protein n=1 Tax=Caenorhabditis remanei TaxID=31234 RepID=E3MB89_CAERE|nr:hypothetical protein CRE_16139 [Caenorhabditis remanei]